ncbi:hypothetical protein M072_3790 [Bacteroides fragilis str. DS-208]|nr:hypothetical protein M072_3790 [Bacteroides fragilis str. DS-208]
MFTNWPSNTDQKECPFSRQAGGTFLLSFLYFLNLRKSR